MNALLPLVLALATPSVATDALPTKEILTLRAANGGHLTAGERAQVNREENRESRRIYAAKHNARHQ